MGWQSSDYRLGESGDRRLRTRVNDARSGMPMTAASVEVKKLTDQRIRDNQRKLRTDESARVMERSGTRITYDATENMLFLQN